DPVTRRREAIVVHVQLSEPNPTLVLMGEFLAHGCDHPARTTPRRPEIHDHHTLGGLDLRLEILIRQRDHGCLLAHLAISSPVYDSPLPLTGPGMVFLYNY